MYDSYSNTLTDGSSNTLCVINDQAFAYINAGKINYPIVIDVSQPVVFSSNANFFTPVKPTAIYPAAKKGIVLQADAGTLSVTAQFFITQE